MCSQPCCPARLSWATHRSRRFSAYKRAMASVAASTCGASKLATGASPISSPASQVPSGAPLVEHAQERRQALDGEWYTMEEFKKFYQKPYGSFSAWRRYWDQAERGAVLPGASQPGSSEVAGRSPAERGAVGVRRLLSARAPGERRQAGDGRWYTEGRVQAVLLGSARELLSLAEVLEPS